MPLSFVLFPNKYFFNLHFITLLLPFLSDYLGDTKTIRPFALKGHGSYIVIIEDSRSKSRCLRIFSGCRSSKYERALLAKLFESDYDLNERPVVNDTDAVVVTLGLTLNQIVDVVSGIHCQLTVTFL